jgi:hypothetical protein
MADDLDSDWVTIEEEEPSEEDRGKYHGLIEAIKDRCNKRQIAFSESPSEDWGVRLSIDFPAGRGKRAVSVLDLEDAEWLIGIPFEDIHFIEDFAAICSYTGKMIAGAVHALDSAGADPFFVRNYPRGLVSRILGEKGDETTRSLSLEGPDHPGCKVTLKPAGPDVRLLTRSSYEIRIEGVQIITNEMAAEVLRKIANSLFLQIETVASVSLTLARRQRRIATKHTSAAAEKERRQFLFPKFEYDADPMTFYWYAVGAAQSPLIQFLGFYQSIEYYYNVFSEAVAKRIIRTVLKEPNFHPDRDADLARVIGAVKNNVSKGYGSERAALRSTLKECVPDADMRAFIKEDDQRATFLSKDKLLKVQLINLSPTNTEIVREVADRIYDLRCRIVHAKPGDDERIPDPLLPYTPEEASLFHDISLARFCARKVIATSAVPLRLPGPIG